MPHATKVDYTGVGGETCNRKRKTQCDMEPNDVSLD